MTSSLLLLRGWLLVLAVECVMGYNGAFEQRKIAAAEFALEELRKTSDTGVYDSLKILSVENAHEEDGIFHHNMIMDLKLGSPHFASGLDYGYYSVVVMKHKETGERSLAIDEFPAMNDAAIEKYWIAKVKRKRAEREEAFRRMEMEALLLDEEGFQPSGGVKSGGDDVVTQQSLQELSIEELFGVLEDVLPSHAAKRREASKVLLGHISKYRKQEGLSRVDEEEKLEKFSKMEEEEKLLETFSLSELFTLSVGNHDGLFSEYLVYRSRQILDAVLSSYAE